MSKANLLIVEDENIVALDIQTRLESLGYNVVDLASSGEEAIKKTEEHNPDLILMDIRLRGDMDGVEAASRIRRDFDIPIIYLTAYADQGTLDRAKITAPFGYLLKPFEERELSTSIEMALYKHKMEKKLVENERWLNTILKSITDGVIATNNEGEVTFMNPVAKELTGWSEEEAQGQDLARVFQIRKEDSEEIIENPLEQIVSATEVDGFSGNTILRSRRGNERIVSERGAPICDEKEETKGAVIVFRDITERKKLEVELQRAQKLETLGILAGGIAHDFNNLLTAIVGYLYAARKMCEEDNPLYPFLTEAENSVFRAKELTKHLLSFTKGGKPQKKTIEIEPLLKDCAEFALPSEDYSCHFDIPSQIWKVEVDPAQIQQVFQNLLLNAVQAMPEGGDIYIEAQNISSQERDRALPLSGSPYIKITVEDRGQGIPSEALDRIFDPYFTTKAEGNGLGLAIAFAVISKHKGLLTVESEMKEYTRFKIYLPAIDKI